MNRLKMNRVQSTEYRVQIILMDKGSAKSFKTISSVLYTLNSVNFYQLFCHTPWARLRLIMPTISSLGSMMMMRFWLSFWK